MLLPVRVSLLAASCPLSTSQLILLPSLSSELALACDCAQAAGGVLAAEFSRGSTVTSEAGREIKLAADVLAEECILRRLRSASPHPILSEEAGADADLGSSGLRWVVDPLDGTYNFSRRLPACCVSIGLCDGERPVLGVIHDFLAGITYAGGVGLGATRNRVPIQVSNISDPSQATLCSGFAPGRNYEDGALLSFVRAAQAHRKIRLFGSAALSLAYLAAGNVDVYFEEDINLWDVAAGLALVEAAGGSFQMRSGRGRFQRDVFASNHLLRDSLKLPDPGALARSQD